MAVVVEVALKVELVAVEAAMVIFGAQLGSGNVLVTNFSIRIALVGYFWSPTWLIWVMSESEMDTKSH